MLRKIATLSIALFVACGVLTSVPADAATKISNGVACTKAGATTKVSTTTYKCAKNPLLTSTKLVWLSADCLSAANDAVKSQNEAAKTIADFKNQIPIIDAGIASENTNKLEIQAKLDEANKRLVGAQAKLAAATTDAEKKILTAAVTSWTSATRAYASKIRGIDLTIRKLESAKLLATNKPNELAANIANARDSAKLICTSGF